MSTVFYIANRKKKEEYKNFCKFLEDYKEKMTNDFTEYVNNTNGLLINMDNLDWDIEKKIKDFINSMQYSIDEEEIRFGQVSARGFTFFMDHTCGFLTNFNAVKEYLEKNTDCIIIDEYNDEYDLETFKQIVETGVIPD